MGMTKEILKMTKNKAVDLQGFPISVRGKCKNCKVVGRWGFYGLQYFHESVAFGYYQCPNCGKTVAVTRHEANDSN